MADGITISGTGATRKLRFQNDAVAPNGLYYRAQDFAAAFPADFIDLGTTPKSYRSLCMIENGDGVGTLQTTWQDQGITIYFDPGFTYQVNATGRVNRWTKWGVIDYGADGEPIGYDGVNAFFGALTDITGNSMLGGCDLRNYTAGASAGRILILPNVAGAIGECVDTDVLTIGGSQGYGNAVAPLRKLRRVTGVGLGTGSAVIVQFDSEDADTPTFYFPNANRKVQTGGFIKMRNPRFVGPSVLSDVQANSGGFFENPRWSRSVVKSGLATVTEFVPLTGVVRAGGSRVAGALVQVFDKNGRLIVDVRTDANGQTSDYVMAPSLVYPVGGTPFENVVAVVAPEIISGTPYALYQGPFRLEVNGDLAIAGYPKVVRYLEAEFDEFLGTEREYYPISFTVDLEDPNATTPETYYRESEIAAMIAEFGQDVSVAGVTVKGIVEDRSVEVVAGDGVAVAVQRYAIVKTGSLPGLAVGVQVGTDGVTYLAADVRQVGDGAVTEVRLALD